MKNNIKITLYKSTDKKLTCEITGTGLQVCYAAAHKHSHLSNKQVLSHLKGIFHIRLDQRSSLEGTGSESRYFLDIHWKHKSYMSSTAL